MCAESQNEKVAEDNEVKRRKPKKGLINIRDFWKVDSLISKHYKIALYEKTHFVSNEVE